VVFRLVNMLTLGLSVFFHGLRCFRRGDRVMVVTTPPSMPFIVGLASLFKGAIYTLLIHDCYPEGPIAVGMLKKGSFTARTIDFFNRWLYKHANTIIVVGRDMKELIERKSDGLDARIEVIPNWAEIDDVRPTPRCENRLLDELGLSEKLVILHAGNIGHPTEVETLIKAFVTLKDDDRFHFLFIGSGVKKSRLEKAIEEHALSNVTLLPPRPRSDQIEFLNGCDIGLVSLVEGMWGAAMPSKTYNIMAAGKPVLALTEPDSELARVIDEDQIGWHLRPGNADRLVGILKNIYLQRPQLNAMGQRARSASEEKYSFSRAVDRYAAVLK
jgi:colanic acid biosynthesis glycosyl transferase WcaI